MRADAIPYAGILRFTIRVPSDIAFYQKDMIRLERYSRETDERYYVYKRSAEEGDPEYSPLHHDAPQVLHIPQNSYLQFI